MSAPLDTKVTYEELAEQLKRLEGQPITNSAGLALHIVTNVNAERAARTRGDGAAAKPQPEEGWSRIIPPQKKFHYFVDGRSLCGRYGFPPLPLTPDDFTSPDDCAGCRKKLALRQMDRRTPGYREPAAEAGATS